MAVEVRDPKANKQFAYMIGNVTHHSEETEDGDLFIAADERYGDKLQSPFTRHPYLVVRIENKHRQWVATELCKHLSPQEWEALKGEVSYHFEEEEIFDG